jgi:hypothetical protein
MSDADVVPDGVDPTRPSPARLYDYYLGGTHNYEVDRQAAEQMRAVMPELGDAAWANRGFHGRAAVWMAAEHGIRQFIDLGSGLPTQNNTHQAVARVTPEARVVYVDNDPIVAAYGTPLLAGDGSTALITADLRDPDGVLEHPEVRRLIDFAEPVGVLMTAVLHFVADGSDPWGLVRRYMAATAPGSYLALSQVTSDNMPPTRGRWRISPGSSTGWSSCRRTPAPRPPSPTWACGGPRIRRPRIPTGPASGTAASPAVPDPPR